MKLSADGILAERLRRQCLSRPLADRRGLSRLFRALQPVSTGVNVRPGSPPRLKHRTTFDDEAATDRLRRDRTIVKGRFQGGGVGYVYSGNLGLYANAFCKPLNRPSATQQAILEAVNSTGPLPTGLIKEETGLLIKQITPALHRLQQAFLVYEDQVDEDWERGWYEFASEWPAVELGEEHRLAACWEVLLRFITVHVFATAEQLRDWSRWPVRLIDQIISCLEREGRLITGGTTAGEEGWLLPSDSDLAEEKPASSVFMLDRQDPLTRPQVSELGRRFGDRVLQYLLIDGEFRGAVHGRWGFKPYDVEDITVELPAGERRRRREEILAAVGLEYHPPHNPIRRYAGAKL